MSLFTSQLSFLTLRPSVSELRDSLVIKTGNLAALLSLFLNTRHVEISASSQTVTLSRRTAYIYSSSVTININEVAYIDYGFSAIGTDWGWNGLGIGQQDSVESYSISIVTQDGKKHFVCAFRGEGSTCTGWSGILLGDDSIVDFAGTQDDESRKLAKYIAKLLGVTIGKPLDEIAEMTTCPECDRPASLYKPTCLYCGAAINFNETLQGEAT
jgi:hypothetical protein